MCTCNCDPPYSIIITEAKEGDLINISTNVTGEFSGKLPGDRYMWVAVRNAARTTALCWPQEGRIDPIEGYPWTVPCRFGGENDSGAEYYVAAILMDKVDHQKCEDYITRGRATNNWTPIQLSASANTVDIVKVTRYKKEHRLAEDDPSGLIKSI